MNTKSLLSVALIASVACFSPAFGMEKPDQTDSTQNGNNNGNPPANPPQPPNNDDQSLGHHFWTKHYNEMKTHWNLVEIAKMVPVAFIAV